MDGASTTKPLVSILIPAHNAASTLQVAINSCLNQTYHNLEIIVNLNNCSDASLDIIKNIKSSKLHYIETTEQGIAHARNALVQAAQGKYIAWLDADDIALHKRIELQVYYMEMHPNVDVLGTYAKLRGTQLNVVKWPTKNMVLCQWLYFKNPMVQSSLMIRASSQPNYLPQFDYIEDFEWLCRGINQGKINKIAILNQALVSYLVPPVSKAQSYQQTQKLELIIQSQWQQLGIPWNPQSQEFFKLVRGLQTHKKLVLLSIKYMLAQPWSTGQKAIVYYYLIYFIKTNKSGIALALRYLYLLPAAWLAAPKYK